MLHLARPWDDIKYELRCSIALTLIQWLMRVLPEGPKRTSFANCIVHSRCFGLGAHK